MNHEYHFARWKVNRNNGFDEKLLYITLLWEIALPEADKTLLFSEI